MPAFNPFMTMRSPALLAFAIYFFGSLLIGEFFPFSRFSMYANISPHAQGAIPVFLANGVAAEARDFKAFYGLEPIKFRAPQGVACSLGYLVDERAAWVAQHPASTAGPVQISVGFDQISLVEGEIKHDLLITTTGSAWP